MDIELANQIKKLKPSVGFIVTSKQQRQDAVNIARLLKMAGTISFGVTTREVEKGKWKVFAV